MKAIITAITTAALGVTSAVALAGAIATAPVETETATAAPAAIEATHESAGTYTDEIADEIVLPTADEAVAEEAAEAEAEVVEAPAATEAAEAAAEPKALAGTDAEVEAKDSTTYMGPRTINVSGDVMGYVDYFGASSAPERGAGLWLGSDSTTDGTWGYFIGHNPGDFHKVMDLKNGDAVTVCDTDGNSRTYYVVDAFFVTCDTYFGDIEERVTGYGESIVVQTCVGDGQHYRVVVCK